MICSNDIELIKFRRNLITFKDDNQLYAKCLVYHYDVPFFP